MNGFSLPGKLNSSEVSLFEELFSVASNTDCPSKVDQVQDIIASRCEELGITVARHSAQPEGQACGKMLHAQKAKEAVTDSSQPLTITLVMHADIVSQKKQNVLGRSDAHFLGQGVADDKGGIFVALRALEGFFSRIDSLHCNIHLVSSPNEEKGSPGFLPFFHELGRSSDIVFGMEPALSCGSLISSRNGNRWYEVDWHAKAFHTGRAAKGALNSAHQFCRFYSELCNHASEDDEVALNLAQLRGGNDTPNISCSEVHAKFDLRFRSVLGRDHFHEAFLDKMHEFRGLCREDGTSCQQSWRLTDDCPPMENNARGLKLAHLLSETISRLEGRDVRSVHCGGTADINHLSTSENLCVDGLGPVGGRLHRSDEYIERKSLVTRSNALCEILFQMNQRSSKLREELLSGKSYESNPRPAEMA